MLPESPDEYTPRDFVGQPALDYPDYRSTQARAPRRPLVAVPQSLADRTGPAFGHLPLGESDHDLIVNFAAAGQSAIGERIAVHGRVLDEAGRPVRQALIEIWQANAGGRYRHASDGYLAPLDPHFGGCGRCMTGDDGRYQFRTVRPGPYPWPNGGNDWRPAHIHLSVFGAAFCQRLVTQMYFQGDPHIAICPIVQSVGDVRAVEQLTARLDMAASVPMDLRAYRFDIVLRGPRSTPFE